MANSLQDQLLKTGIVNKQKASKVNAEKRKKAKQLRQSKSSHIDQDKLAIQQSQQQKAEKDRQLNQQRQQQLQAKASEAQIRQLILNHRQPQNDSEVAYHFADNNIVNKVYIDDSLRNQISKGQMAIVKLDNHYEVIPVNIAIKISEFNRDFLIVMNNPEDSNKETAADGDYADYEIPSDLIW